jgi:DNA-binding transcriptional LysR family regulator
VPINLARFDLASIQLALHCAELGSLSAAARRMHCSLATASHRVSALEHALGGPLFTRDHRGLHINAAGELFVRHARLLLDHVELLERAVRHEMVTGPDAAGLSIFRSPE